MEKKQNVRRGNGFRKTNNKNQAPKHLYLVYSQKEGQTELNDVEFHGAYTSAKECQDAFAEACHYIEEKLNAGMSPYTRAVSDNYVIYMDARYLNHMAIVRTEVLDMVEE